MKKPPESLRLSELEGATLALIKRHGPCTPYFVRSMFERSPSDFWSGSSGAIYPLIRRLEAKGLLSSQATQTGKRKGKLYSLSQTGDIALQDWLLDVKRGASIGFDPMRIRLHYADLYDREDLRQYGQDTMAHMMAEIPPPVSDNPDVPKIHDIWLSHRKAAVEEIMAVLSADKP